MVNKMVSFPGKEVFCRRQQIRLTGIFNGPKNKQKRLITSGLYLLRLRHHRQEDDGLRLCHVARRLHPHPGGHEAGPDLRKAVCDKDHEWSYCKKDHLF